MNRDRDTGHPLEFDQGIINKAEVKAEENRVKAEEINRSITSAVAFLERAKGTTREALEIKELHDTIAQAQDFLAEHVLSDTPVIRRKVRMTLMAFELNKPAESAAEAEEILTNLVRQKLLTESRGGTLQAYGKGYDVPTESLFGEEEVEEMGQTLKTLIGRVRMAEKNRPTLTWEQIMAGKPGLVHLDVPTGDDGRGHYLPSGNLRGYSDGQWFTPTKDTLGGILKSVNEAINLGEGKVRISISSLEKNQPPFLRNTDRAVADKIWSIWFMMDRARQMQNKKLEYANRATIDGTAFSAKTPGICYVDLQDPWEVWQTNDGQAKVVRTIYNMFLLVERVQKEDGATYIQILDVPPHLKDFFTASQEKECEYKEGERYEGCPLPLGSILRAFYKQCTKALGNAAKADMIAGEQQP